MVILRRYRPAFAQPTNFLKIPCGADSACDTPLQFVIFAFFVVNCSHLFWFQLRRAPSQLREWFSRLKRFLARAKFHGDSSSANP